MRVVAVTWTVRLGKCLGCNYEHYFYVTDDATQIVHIGENGAVVRTEDSLVHEVVGWSPVSGISAPQIRGLDDSASGIGQANRFQLSGTCTWARLVYVLLAL